MTERLMSERLRVLRVLVGAFAVAYLVVRLPHLLGLAHYHDARFAPVGILAGFDTPLAPGLFQAILLAAIPLGVAFTAGWRVAWSGPAFAALLLLVTTYRSSWGQVFHTENLLVFDVLILAVAYAFPRRDATFVVRLLAIVTVTTYFVSGWAKLRGGGWDWILGDTLRNQIAYDNVRKAALGAPYSPFGAWAVGHPLLFPPLAVAALTIELGAPLALLGRRWAGVWAAMAWLFHLAVFALMAIVFAYPLSGVAFAPLLPVERLPTALTRVRREGAGIGFLSRRRETTPRRSSARSNEPVRR
jgi:hypothetical protein